MKTVDLFAPRLALGTVQFGLNYGVSNAGGQVPEAEAAGILRAARAAGVRTLDTARAYGTAEAVLGRVLPEVENSATGGAFEIITKIPALKTLAGASAVECALASTRDMGRARLDGLLFHAEEDLLTPEGEFAWRALEGLKHEGRIGKLGVSCYSPEVLARVAERYPIEVIQVPANALDLRFFTPELVALYARRGIEVHVRSVFLQGLFFMRAADVPARMGFARPTLAALESIATRVGATPAALSLAAVLAQPAVGKVVVGVTRAAELEDILCWLLPPLPPWVETALQEARAQAHPAVTDPREWPRA